MVSADRWCPGLPRTARYLESAYSAGASRRSARNQGKSAVEAPGPGGLAWALARVFHRVFLVVDRARHETGQGLVTLVTLLNTIKMARPPGTVRANPAQHLCFQCPRPGHSLGAAGRWGVLSRNQLCLCPG